MRERLHGQSQCDLQTQRGCVVSSPVHPDYATTSETRPMKQKARAHPALLLNGRYRARNVRLPLGTRHPELKNAKHDQLRETTENVQSNTKRCRPSHQRACVSRAIVTESGGHTVCSFKHRRPAPVRAERHTGGESPVR